MLAIVVVATVINVASVEAASITIDGVGDAFSVDLIGESSERGYPLSLESDWLTTLYTSTTIRFQITMVNNSPAPTTAAQLTGFGFDTDRDVTGGTTGDSSIFTTLLLTDDSPTFSFDVCMKSGNQTNNCKGNGGGESLGIGEVETFYLTLTFDSTAGGITLSNFGARFQGIDDGDSAKIYGEPYCTSCSTVPEPASILLFGAGGAALATRVRRRRKDA